MIISNQFLHELTMQAKVSPRLRQHFDLRDSSSDGCQRMLNAIEPGTIIPIHRHSTTSEDVIVLRGKAEEVFFDSSGTITESYLLSPGGMIPGSYPAIHVPIGQYHTCRSLESGTVLIEFKNTKYDSEKTEEFL